MPRGSRSSRPSHLHPKSNRSYYHVTPVTTPTSQYTPLNTPQQSTSMSSNNSYYSSQSVQTVVNRNSNNRINNGQAYETAYPSPAYPIGGPMQHPLQPQYTNEAHSQQTQRAHDTEQSMSTSTNQPLTSIRPSSGAWSPADDAQLISARSSGMSWSPIQATYFPTKTPNACRKRHERLMERRNNDDWDNKRVEGLAKAYMERRKEIWTPLAQAVGEKWGLVEMKCMQQGLKNLQAASRSYDRHERIGSSHLHSGNNYRPFDNDDSGFDNSEEHDGLESYGDDGCSDRSAYAYSMGMSVSGTGGGLGRLPSMDMGIDAIINRHDGAR